MKKVDKIVHLQGDFTFPLTFWLAREHNTQPGWHKKPFRIVSVSDEHYDQDLRLEVLQFGKVVVIS